MNSWQRGRRANAAVNVNWSQDKTSDAADTVGYNGHWIPLACRALEHHIW